MDTQPTANQASTPVTGSRALGRRQRGTLLLAEAKESFSMAMGAITAHKLRSCLTLLGVLVGVFSIILVMTAMRALQSNVEQELSQMGSYTFAIRKFPAVYFGGPDGFEKFWRRKNITMDHCRRVMERASLAQSIGIEVYLWGGEATSRFAKTPPNVILRGGSPGIFPARNLNIAEGRSFNDGDVDSARDVCILAYGLAKILFPFGPAVGEQVKFAGLRYTVVGVLEKHGSALGGDQDNFAFIPVTAGLNRYGRYNNSLALLVQAQNQATFDDTVEQVRGILRAVRKVPPGKEDDFEIFSNDSLIAQFKSFTLTVRAGVAVVSSIALVAAGIGIMNIMLVSVTERTREIGIRRAVGAKKRNIMLQFILEAVVLCEIGGVAGVALGLISGNIGARLMEVAPVVPVDWVILGLGICSLVGVVFGTYPAYKAANLDPIESLRYE